MPKQVVMVKKQQKGANPMASFANAAAAAAEKPEPPKSSDGGNQLPKDFKTWISMYPAYIDATKSLQEGRRVNRDKCIPGPRLQELMIAGKILGLKFVAIPSKRYPRDFFNPGKIYLCIEDKETGVFLNPEITNRDSMYISISKKIAELRADYKAKAEAAAAAEAEAKAKKKAKKEKKGRK